MCRISKLCQNFTDLYGQNALIFRGIKLWNTTPKAFKHSVNLARFKKYLKRYLLKSSENPDI